MVNSLRANPGCWIAIWILLLGCWPVQGSIPNYFTRVWQADDGLPKNGVSAIVQSREGYLWIGTYSGLARFDGMRFKVFNSTTTPEMFSSRVTSLFEDSTGNLWIGFETGGLMRYKDGRFQSSETPAWNGRRILSIAEDQAGDIWALGVAGLLLRVRDGLVLPVGRSLSRRWGTWPRTRPGRCGFCGMASCRCCKATAW